MGRAIGDSIAMMCRGELLRYASKSTVLMPPSIPIQTCCCTPYPIEIGWLEQGLWAIDAWKRG